MFVFLLTLTQQLSVRSLLEDDDSRPKRRQGHIQTAAAGKGPELRGEMLQIGPRGAAQELEHVVVEAFSSCTVDDDIRHCQHLEGEEVCIELKKEYNDTHNICQLCEWMVNKSLTVAGKCQN